MILLMKLAIPSWLTVPFESTSATSWEMVGSNINSVQQATNISKATAALFTFVTLSRAMHA